MKINLFYFFLRFLNQSQILPRFNTSAVISTNIDITDLRKAEKEKARLALAASGVENLERLSLAVTGVENLEEKKGGEPMPRL